MKNQKGFTLIEIMIVVAVITILASFAIPSYLRSKLAANEASAIGALKTLSNGQAAFRAACALDTDVDGAGEFGSFTHLSAAIPPFVDDSLGSGQKSGYIFVITTTGISNSDEIMWEATAYPMLKGQSGNRTFYIDESGVLRGSDLGGPIGVVGTPGTRAIALPSAGGTFRAL